MYQGCSETLGPRFLLVGYTMRSGQQASLEITFCWGSKRLKRQVVGSFFGRLVTSVSQFARACSAFMLTTGGLHLDGI